MRLLVRMGVIFTNAKKPAASKVRDPIGIAHGRVRGDGFGRSAGTLPIQPLIGKIGKIQDSFRYTVRPASVFMDPSANVQWDRSEAAMGPFVVPLDNRMSSALTGAAFDPEHLIPIEGDLSESD